MERSSVLKQALATAGALAVVAACGSLPPARSDAVFAGIERGMSMEQVRERLGPPDEAMAFPLTRTLSWTYFYFDTWGFYADESITFDAGGHVVDKFSQRVGYGGSGRD